MGIIFTRNESQKVREWRGSYSGCYQDSTSVADLPLMILRDKLNRCPNPFSSKFFNAFRRLMTWSECNAVIIRYMHLLIENQKIFIKSHNVIREGRALAPRPRNTRICWRRSGTIVDTRLRRRTSTQPASYRQIRLLLELFFLCIFHTYTH